MRNPCSFRLIATEQTQGLGVLRQGKDDTQRCEQLYASNDQQVVDCGVFC